MSENGNYVGDGRLSLDQLASWAEDYSRSRPCDIYLGRRDDHQLERWYVIPRNDQFNVYIHRFLRSDDDRAPHDHVADNSSLLLRGQYREVTPDGSNIYQAGDWIHRRATDLHRVELVDGPTLSLFVIQRPARIWGFQTPDGWEDFQTFYRKRGEYVR